MSYSVYIHTNRINGKRYVGVSRIKPEYRWRNGEGYKRQPHFYSAIKEYGWDNFDHFILEVDTIELMYQLEQQYIAYYKTTDRRYGYNKSFGGETGAYLGKDCYSKDYGKRQYAKHSEEIKARNKKYYEDNKEKVKERAKKYRDTHKEEIRERERLYREKNKEKDRERHRKYYQLHREYLDKKNKENYRRWYYSHKHKDVEPITPLW